MLEPIRRIFLFIYYFIYNLFKGKDEWKCDNEVETKPVKACCTTVTANDHNHNHENLINGNKGYLSTPRPYQDASKKSWWQWIKNGCFNGWQKVKLAFAVKNTRGGNSKIIEWLKFFPIQLWRGIKWILSFFWRILLWFINAFMLIFRSSEAKSEESPKQYVYKKIESPRDYVTYDDNDFDDQNKTEETNLKSANRVEITLDEKGEPEPAEITSAQSASAFSTEQFREPEENKESPISFYARRVSVASSKSGDNPIPKLTSPPPPAPPPPPKVAIRIPTTAPEVNNEKTPSAGEAVVKGGVSVIVPGLMDAAKESIQRRRRGRTLSPDASEHRNVGDNAVPTPYRSPSVMPTSMHSTRVNTNNVVTRINTQTPTSEAFLFHPRSQTARNIEFTNTHKSEEWSRPESRQQQRMFSTSPTPSGTFLLGQSVFKPVNEVERIRDNFNRKSESRAASVFGGDNYSRSSSVMSQSYHHGQRDYPTYTPSRDTYYESSGAYLRNRFPVTSTSIATYNNDYPGSATTKWHLRNNGKEDDVFSRLPSGGTRRILERKVTEKHIEKDVDGQVLNGWREQNWMGTYEQFDSTKPML